MLCQRGIYCHRVSVCLCLSVSVTIRYCVETTGQIEVVFVMDVCCKEMCVPPKIRALPSGTLSQTLDLENFAAAGGSRCQQNSSR